MQTIAELPDYQTDASRWLSAEEQDAVRQYLSLHPTSGDLIPGTGGIRKLRWRRPGMGKRGGLRIIYYFYNRTAPLYLLNVFGKNEKDDLSEREKQLLAKIVQQIIQYWRNHYGK